MTKTKKRTEGRERTRKKADSRRIRLYSMEGKKKEREKTTKRREENRWIFLFGPARSRRSYPRREISRERFVSTDRSIGTDSSTLESRNSRWVEIVPIDAPMTTARRPRIVCSPLSFVFSCLLLVFPFRFFLIFCFSFICIEFFFFFCSFKNRTEIFALEGHAEGLQSEIRFFFSWTACALWRRMVGTPSDIPNPYFLSRYMLFVVNVPKTVSINWQNKGSLFIRNERERKKDREVDKARERSGVHTDNAWRALLR